MEHRKTEEYEDYQFKSENQSLIEIIINNQFLDNFPLTLKILEETSLIKLKSCIRKHVPFLQLKQIKFFSLIDKQPLNKQTILKQLKEEQTYFYGDALELNVEIVFLNGNKLKTENESIVYRTSMLYNDLCIDIVSLSNNNGGVVLIGVDPQCLVQGLQSSELDLDVIQKELQEVMDGCINPTVDLQITPLYLLNEDEDKNMQQIIICIQVDKFKSKDIFYTHNCVYYQRKITKNIKYYPHEVILLYKKRKDTF